MDKLSFRAEFICRAENTRCKTQNNSISFLPFYVLLLESCFPLTLSICFAAINLRYCIYRIGQVSYRYATRKGLSTKFLCVFDLEVPEDFKPYNGDGEVRRRYPSYYLFMPSLVCRLLVTDPGEDVLVSRKFPWKFSQRRDELLC